MDFSIWVSSAHFSASFPAKCLRLGFSLVTALSTTFATTSGVESPSIKRPKFVYSFNKKYPTTGPINLDSLIDSIQEGQCYLFYGSKKILEGLVHGLLVNCVLPREKHGFESMALYINNVDYYQPDKSKVLSPERIAGAAKYAGMEPKIVFKNLFVRDAHML